MPHEPLTVALVQPGEMGAAIGGQLVANGHRVLYASEGRSPETQLRAMRAGILDVGTREGLRSASLVLSICPPHAALDVAREMTGIGTRYLDANAISPESAETVRSIVEAGRARYVDGGILGAPPGGAGRCALLLSGPDAEDLSETFRTNSLETKVLDGPITAASALKMVYASWTKGSLAMILATMAAARAYGVEDALRAEWAPGRPGLPGDDALLERLSRAGLNAARKGWRWAGEMEEIAATFGAAGLPDQFHLAAAEVYRRSPHDPNGKADDATVRQVLAGLVGEEP